MRLLKIGRDASCDIVLHSDKVSSLHAELTLMNSGDIMLEDKGSRNGTFIMNQAIKPGKPVNVRRGDAIRFADVELQWSQVPMPEDNSAYKAIYGIGSHFNNDIQISGGTVSRYHATIKIGKDNKVYIIDHSKNGTTVDGNKIPSNNPVRIKKSSSVVCGGVPVNLRDPIVKWPSETWKTVALAAACLLVLVGVGLGIWKALEGKADKVMTDTELYARYNHSVVMLMGIYHYEVSVGDLDLEQYNANADAIYRMTGKITHISPQLVFDESGNLNLASGLSSKDLIDMKDKKGNYTGTGFFISKDGQLITNLHVVKPWLFDGSIEQLQNILSKRLALYVEFMQNYKLAVSGVVGATLNPSTLTAYLSKVKVEGVLDYVALIPQGEIYDPDNIIKCKVVSAGEDVNKDVALIRTVGKRLPTDCTFVNVTDSMDISDEALTVGTHVYTLGFPTGTNYSSVLQKENEKTGIQVIGQGGTIIQQNSEFDFGHNAPTTGGASGSPIFNDQGMLIGVHHQGLSRIETQGYNYGVKAKYIKELLESPHVQ